MSDADELKIEIAAAAARLIAEEGCDYATAKRKAVRSVLGEDRNTRGLLPDNAQIEDELRRYLSTFAADAQPAQLAALRALALQWMHKLAAFNPHLVGAVLNGTATEHSDIHLHLFSDNVKDVEIFLLNEGLDFEVDEGGDSAQEQLQLLIPTRRAGDLPPRVGLILSLHHADAIRVAARGRSEHPDLHAVEAAGRASVLMLERLLADTDKNAEGGVR